MNSKCQVWLVLMLLVGGTAAQPLPRPLRSDDGKAGYANSVGVYEIPPTFQSADPFSPDGFARVKLHNKVGFIDIKGKFVVPPAFDGLENEYRSDAPMRAMTRTKEKPCGELFEFVTAEGKLAFPNKYEWAYVFSEGLAHVAEFEHGPCGQRASKHGFIDTVGRVAIPIEFADARSFGKNGLAAAKVGNKWGFINQTGNFVIAPQFDDVSTSSESAFDDHGLARVKIGDATILVNAKGQRLSSDSCDFVGPFNAYGLAIVGCGTVLRGRKAGVIDLQGKFVCTPQFDDIHGFSNGYSQVKQNGRWGYINTRCEIVVPPQFPIYGQDFTRSGIARVTLGYRSRLGGRPGDVEPIDGYINTSGKLFIAPGQYDKVLSNSDINIVSVFKDGKAGFVDSEGKEVVGWFDDAGSFSASGLASVMIDGKWGYVDLKGDLVINPTFDGAYRFVAGVAIVKVAGKSGHINTTGAYITQPIYEKVGLFSEDGLASATLNGNAGYVDLGGNFHSKH